MVIQIGVIGILLILKSDAFSYSTHLSESIICLDFSNSSSTINLNALIDLSGPSSTYPYSWMRMKVNDTVVADINGNTAFTRSYSNSNTLSGNVGVISYDNDGIEI